MSIGSSRRKVIAGLLLWPGFARAQFANGISGGNVNGLSLVLNQAAPAWTPALLPGLVAWYDAQTAASITLNGSTVAQWNDQSSNHYNAVQGTAANQPVYSATGLNGKPALSFNGTTQSLNAPVPAGPFSAALTWCYVVTGMAQQGAIFGRAPGNAARPIQIWNGNTVAYMSGGGINPTGLMNYTTPALFIHDYVHSTDAWNAYVNGTQVKHTQPAGVTLNDTATSLGIGWDLTFYETSILGEGIACAGILDADRQKLEGYLAWKWGLAGLLPAGHPFKSGPPDINGNPITVPILTGAESDGTDLGYSFGLGGSSNAVAPSVVAPDGSTGAVTFFKEDGTTTWHYANAAGTGLTQQTLSIYAKPSGVGSARYLTFVFSTSAGNPGVIFDVLNGIATSVTPGTSVTFTKIACQPAANGFFKCTISATTTLASFTSIRFYLSPSPTGAPNPSYAGDNTSGLYLWRVKVTTP